MFIYKADFNLFRYSSIFLPYLPHAVYSQLELVMDFTYSIYYFIVFMYLSGREFLYICIGVYMNTHSKAVKCRKRDSLKPFLGKIIQKTTFLKLFSCYEKRLHSSFLPLHRQNKEVWVSGLNQHTANVPNRKVPKVRILLLPHFGSLAQLDQSTTLRTSVSGVRVSHESQHWRFGRVGLLHRS